MAEPTTVAGKALVEKIMPWLLIPNDYNRSVLVAHILAIEAEARADAESRLLAMARAVVALADALDRNGRPDLIESARSQQARVITDARALLADRGEGT